MFSFFIVQNIISYIEGRLTGHAIGAGGAGIALERATEDTDDGLLEAMQLEGRVPQDRRFSRVGGACVGAVVLVNGTTLFTVTLGDVKWVAFLSFSPRFCYFPSHCDAGKKCYLLIFPISLAHL